MASSSNIAQKTFELNNDVLEIDPADEIFKYDAALQKKIDKESPWSKECVRQGSITRHS